MRRITSNYPLTEGVNMVRAFYVLQIALLLLIASCVQNRPALLTDQDVEELRVEMKHQF